MPLHDGQSSSVHIPCNTTGIETPRRTAGRFFSFRTTASSQKLFKVLTFDSQYSIQGYHAISGYRVLRSGNVVTFGEFVVQGLVEAVDSAQSA